MDDISKKKENSTICDTLTTNILKSDKFKDFCKSLAKWYTLTEMITFNLEILNEYFGFNLEFSLEKFTLKNNFGFSLKSFAKRNILKLVSYFIKNLSFNYSITDLDLDYKKMFFILASAFTCGISMRDFICKDAKKILIIVN